jgi:putative GTP pyrophosphokinase
MSDEANAPVDWANKYADVELRYAQFASRLDELIRALLHSSDLEVIQVESRAKTVASFKEKVERPGKSYKNPLTEVTDLAGIRVITYYVEDVDAVETLLEREFLIDRSRSLDKGHQLNTDQFGYLSRHFVVSLREPRAGLPEWRQFTGLVAEFQVRTALQHAWASVSHKLEYKTELEVPSELRRGLRRLSALFELADEQFSEFRDASKEIGAAVAASVARGEYDRPLDLAALLSYIEDTPPAYKELRRQAEKLGGKFKDDAAEAFRDRRDLLLLASASGFRTVADLDNWLGSVAADELPLVKACWETTTDDEPPDLILITFDNFLGQLLNVQYQEADFAAQQIWLHEKHQEWVEKTRSAWAQLREAAQYKRGAP